MTTQSPLTVYSLSLDSAGGFECWLPGLGAAERARAARFVQPMHVRRFVLRRWALRCLIGERTGVAPERVAFTENAYGKPGMAGLRFSTSHSGELALIAIGGEAEFGIDVERMRVLEDADELVERFFSPAERREYAALPIADRAEAFWRGWTVKEAFVKAVGQGLGFPLDAFDVALSPDRPAAIAEVREGHRGPWAVRTIPLGPRYRAAAVGLALPPLGVPRHITMDMLPLPGESIDVRRYVGS
jgi:4'-phosphopantetheinyl transferase